MDQAKKAEPTHCAYASFINSEVFTLFAGQSQKPYRVHKELLASMSPELKNHVFNDMKEDQESCMRMGHVTPQTMCQFLEFCYTGKYAEFADDTIDGDGTGEKKEKAEVDDGRVEGKLGDLLRVPALMAHGRLYVFGDMYKVQRLKDEAFSNINDISRDIGICSHRKRMPDYVAEECVNLMRYACDNLPERPAGRGMDKLMEYLAYFAAWGLKYFIQSKRFMELLSTRGRVDFTEGFLRLLDISTGPESGVVGPWEVFRC